MHCSIGSTNILPSPICPLPGPGDNTVNGVLNKIIVHADGDADFFQQVDFEHGSPLRLHIPFLLPAPERVGDGHLSKPGAHTIPA